MCGKEGDGAGERTHQASSCAWWGSELRSERSIVRLAAHTPATTGYAIVSFSLSAQLEAIHHSDTVSPSRQKWLTREVTPMKLWWELDKAHSLQMAADRPAKAGSFVRHWHMIFGTKEMLVLEERNPSLYQAANMANLFQGTSCVGINRSNNPELALLKKCRN